MPDQDPDHIFVKLRAHLDAQGFDDVEVKRHGQMWPYKAEGDDVCSKPSLLDPLSGGIPVAWAAGVGHWDNRAYSPSEHVRLVNLQNAARHIARIVDGFAHIS